MSANSNSDERLIKKYVKEMKQEFKSDVLKYIHRGIKEKQPWKVILKHLKVYISKALEATEDYKNLELLLEDRKSELNDIEASIVNKTYKIIKPFIERLAKEEAENKRGTTRKYPQSLLRRSFALQYLTSGSKKKSTTLQRERPNATMKNISKNANSFGMGSLARALNDI
jgi:hypothetical protein